MLAADYAFGQQLESDVSAVVTANGGKVLGVRHPLNTSDFSSFLPQAQASNTKVIGLENAGGDTTNAIKQAQFGIVAAGQKLAGLLLFINKVKPWNARRWPPHHPGISVRGEEARGF